MGSTIFASSSSPSREAGPHCRPPHQAPHPQIPTLACKKTHADPPFNIQRRYPGQPICPSPRPPHGVLLGPRSYVYFSNQTDPHVAKQPTDDPPRLKISARTRTVHLPPSPERDGALCRETLEHVRAGHGAREALHVVLVEVNLVRLCLFGRLGWYHAFVDIKVLEHLVRAGHVARHARRSQSLQRNALGKLSCRGWRQRRSMGGDMRARLRYMTRPCDFAKEGWWQEKPRV